MSGPVGVLGGTFDPVHFGHLRLAEEAREALGLVQVLLVPAGRPPHRGAPAASGCARLEMTRLAAGGSPAFAVDAGEVASPEPSYTVTTLLRLRQNFGPDRPLVLVLGADAYLGLPTWMRWTELFELAHIAVALRPGFRLEPMPEALAREHGARRGPAERLAAAPAGAVTEFPMTALDISASGIRALLAAGRSPRYLLPDSVLDYIDRHHLYRKPNGR